MRITFVLPTAATHPIGGFKVVYEYANELAARGHQVNVVHAAYIGGAQWEWSVVLRQLLLVYPIKALLGSWRPRRWFRLDTRVNLYWVPSLAARFVPDADAVVATWWKTAERVAKWPASKGRKHYLIQHLETWGGPEERVLATWKLPLRKIVIAGWLEAKARELGEAVHRIPNGLNFAAFGIDADVSTRDNNRVAMLYHSHPWKGSADGLAALRLAKERAPELRVELFGTGKAPDGLPEWMKYHQNPVQTELRALYNRAAVFITPSWAEGWALPPPEAMMCGCALACTDIGGHADYAIAEGTALLSPVRNPAALADNIVRLVSDPSFRQRLAIRGNAFIQQFTWKRATDRFEAVLRGHDESISEAASEESAGAVTEQGHP